MSFSDDKKSVEKLLSSCNRGEWGKNRQLNNSNLFFSRDDFITDGRDQHCAWFSEKVLTKALLLGNWRSSENCSLPHNNDIKNINYDAQLIDRENYSHLPMRMIKMSLKIIIFVQWQFVNWLPITFSSGGLRAIYIKKKR